MSLDVSIYSRDPEAGAWKSDDIEVFEANITHNLGAMARQFPGLYEAVWRPEERPRVNPEAPVRAHEISKIIRAGYNHMRKNPDMYKSFDSPNGWGLYKDFLPWLDRYATALENNPDHVVRVNR